MLFSNFLIATVILSSLFAIVNTYSSIGYGIIQYADAAQFYIKPDEIVRLVHSGTGTTCPTVTGPTSATSSAGTAQAISVRDSSDSGGCFFNSYIIEDSLFPEELANEVKIILGSGPAGGIRYVIDLDDSDTNYGTCSLRNLDNPNTSILNDIVDPRLNATLAYDALRNGNRHNTDDGFFRCITSLAQRADGEPGDETQYLGRINQTFWAWGISGSTFTRDTTDRFVILDDIFQKFSISFPVNHTNNWWQMQEHPMYAGSYPVISDGFFGNSDSAFTMNTGLTNVDRGQVVIFKQFNKTELIGFPSINVQGSMMSLGLPSDMHIHVEVKDGNFQAGQTQGKNVKDLINFRDVAVEGHDDTAYFERNQFMTYDFQNGSNIDTLYSLGVYDLEDQTTGTVDNFNISFIPNWSNSTSDIISVFVAVQDNSTSGRMIANITSIEIENNIRYNFTAISDLVFYEPNCNTSMATGESIDGLPDNNANCGLDYSNGLVQITNVTTIGFLSDVPPEPESPTNGLAIVTSNSTIDLIWNHNLVNVTNFHIARETPIGGGFMTIVPNTGNITTSYSDSGLSPGTTYNYKVCAMNGSTIETICETMSATTSGLSPGPIIAMFEPQKDSFLRAGDKNTNEGANEILQIQGSGKYRSLVAFNQTAIEDTAGGLDVINATLRLYIEDNANNWSPSGRTIDVHSITADWAEGNGWNVGNNIQGTGSGVTWSCAIDIDISNPQPNCNPEWDGGSFVSTATDSMSITNGLEGQFIEFDVTADVQAFLDGTSNYGWIIKKSQDSQSGSLDFTSREGSTNNPELVIFFG